MKVRILVLAVVLDSPASAQSTEAFQFVGLSTRPAVNA